MSGRRLALIAPSVRRKDLSVSQDAIKTNTRALKPCPRSAACRFPIAKSSPHRCRFSRTQTGRVHAQQNINLALLRRLFLRRLNIPNPQMSRQTVRAIPLSWTTEQMPMSLIASSSSIEHKTLSFKGVKRWCRHSSSRLFTCAHQLPPSPPRVAAAVPS